MAAVEPTDDLDYRFSQLQRRLPAREAARLIVGIPSIDLGPRYEARTDLASFETRWLYLLLALGDPRRRVAIVTSDAVLPHEADHYLELLPDPAGARKRLDLVTVDDLSVRPLAEKLLDRPHVLERLRALTDRAGAGAALIAPFGVSRADRDVALVLDVPIDGIDDRAGDELGTKSGSRRLFAQAGVRHPDGELDLRSPTELVRALAQLRARRAGLTEVVVKLDHGVTGDGNQVLSLRDLPVSGAGRELEARVARLPLWFRAAIASGAVVEELVAGVETASPSVQLRIDPGGRVRVLSTHDQVLTGDHAQTYVACRLPANPAYGPAAVEAAERVGHLLARRGAVGRLAVDFVATRKHAGDWRLHAVEVNLREGGTTHPLGVLQLLSGGGFDADAAVFRDRAGRERRYFATDAVCSDRYSAIRPTRLLDAAREVGLTYDRASGSGVVFFMLRALPREGRLGLVAIGDSFTEADRLHLRTLALLDRLAGRTLRARIAR